MKPYATHSKGAPTADQNLPGIQSEMGFKGKPLEFGIILVGKDLISTEPLPGGKTNGISSSMYDGDHWNLTRCLLAHLALSELLLAPTSTFCMVMQHSNSKHAGLRSFLGWGSHSEHLFAQI